ncbi:unnamed protein product, partial [Onchocerca ochengi]
RGLGGPGPGGFDGYGPGLGGRPYPGGYGRFYGPGPHPGDRLDPRGRSESGRPRTRLASYNSNDRGTQFSYIRDR